MNIIDKVNKEMKYKTIIKRKKLKSKKYYIMQVIEIYNNNVISMQTKKVKCK